MYRNSSSCTISNTTLLTGRSVDRRPPPNATKCVCFCNFSDCGIEISKYLCKWRSWRKNFFLSCRDLNLPPQSLHYNHRKRVLRTSEQDVGISPFTECGTFVRSRDARSLFIDCRDISARCLLWRALVQVSMMFTTEAGISQTQQQPEHCLAPPENEEKIVQLRQDVNSKSLRC